MAIGEARRRKEKDASFGKRDIVKSARKFTDRMLGKGKRLDKVPVICFTNNSKGCTTQDIALLKDQIPQIFASEELIFFALPEDKIDILNEEQNADVADDELLRHFVEIFSSRFASEDVVD